MYLQALIIVLAFGVTGKSGASSGLEAVVPDYPAPVATAAADSAVRDLHDSKEWRAAEKYAAAERDGWREIWEAFGVDAQIAEAVVFPEMVRYSGLRDLAETAAVRALYQQKGSRGADFSIGRFQMKPSFAERVEREWMTTPASAEWGLAFDTADNSDARRARIRRLDDPVWQCTYLAIFLRSVYERHETLAGEEAARQVALCAAAYNAGCGDDLRRMELQAGRSSFHTDFIAGPRTRYYNYAAIAEYYYSNTLTH